MGKKKSTPKIKVYIVTYIYFAALGYILNTLSGNTLLDVSISFKIFLLTATFEITSCTFLFILVTFSNNSVKRDKQVEKYWSTFKKDIHLSFLNIPTEYF